MNNSLDRKITIGSIVKFTMPSIIMMVVMSLYTIVDGIFVSRLVGTDAFSAVNIVFPLLSFVIGLGTMFGTGATAIVSRKLGEGRQKEAREDFTFIILFTILLGAVFSAVCLALLKPIVYALGANEAIYGYCFAYAFPLVLFFVPNILQCEFQSLHVADGKPYIGLAVTVLGGLANVALDYIFIAELKMGISGAALATGIGYSVPAIFGLCYFSFHRKGSLCFVRPKADWRALGNAAFNGSSEMVSNLSMSVTTFLFNIIMMRIAGQNGVAAIAILMYLDFVLVAVNLGYSIGVAPLIGYNYGCGSRERLRKLFKLSTGFCMTAGIFVTVITLLFAEPLTGIFSGRGTDVFEMAFAGMRIYAFSYIFKGFNIFSSALFTAFGDGKTSAVISFMRTLVFLVACLIGLPFIFGINGVWAATPLAELLSFLLAVTFVIRNRKKYHYA